MYPLFLLDTWGMDKASCSVLIHRLKSAARTRKAREKKRKADEEQPS